MKGLFIFTLITFLFFSCTEKKENYSIVGHVENCNGVDSIILAFSSNGILLEQVSQSHVENGQFAFDGHIDNCKIAYICYKGDDCDVCSMFFLENGKMNILIDSTQCSVTGTPLNDLSNEIDDSIRHYISRLEEIEEFYYSDTISDSEFAQLGVEGFNLQENLVGYLRKTIQGNITNLLGLYMLVVYNDFFTSEELNELIAHIPSSSIDKSNNPLYDIIIGVAQERKAWE